MRVRRLAPVGDTTAHECRQRTGHRFTARFKPNVFCQLAVILLCWMPAIATPAAHAQEAGYDPQRFEEAMKQAREYDPNEQRDIQRHDRDKAVQYYREALKWRPGHPDNLEIEFRMGVLLSQYNFKGQGLRRKEGYEVFERIISNYPKNNLLTAQAAILAGDLCGIKAANMRHVSRLAADAIGEHDRVLEQDMNATDDAWIVKAREHYHYALECLAQISKERGAVSGEDAKRIFPQYSPLFAAAVDQYAGSYIWRPPSEKRSAYERVVQEFPGTPLASAAEIRVKEMGEGPEFEWPKAGTVKPSASRTQPETPAQSPNASDHKVEGAKFDTTELKPITPAKPAAVTAQNVQTKWSQRTRPLVLVLSILIIAAGLATAVWAVVARNRRPR